MATTMKTGTNDNRPKRRYDETFKRHAVALSMRGDRTVVSIARELGVAECMLYAWRGQSADRP